MTIIKILTVFLSLYCSFGHGYVPKKIHNGEFVHKGEIPHQVSIQQDGTHICGGSIIDSWHILTAAHCVVETNNEPRKNLKVLSKTTISQAGYDGELRDVKLIISHKYFNYSHYENDIAILLLNEPINLDENQNIIKLSEASFDTIIKPGDTVIASGWGVTEYKQLSTYLKKLKTQVISNEKCSEIDPYTKSKKFICTQATIGHSICAGDSGGPLVYEGVLVGIAARSNCDGVRPDIFTKVSYYTQWIRSVIIQYPK